MVKFRDSSWWYEARKKRLHHRFRLDRQLRRGRGTLVTRKLHICKRSVCGTIDDNLVAGKPFASGSLKASLYATVMPWPTNNGIYARIDTPGFAADCT
jgi:hypothetical protein